MAPDPESVTRWLKEWQGGDPSAMNELIPLVYDELGRLARRQMRGERAGHSLRPTELVHEAYGRMVGLELSWQDRVHFFRMAARTMRRVLVDHARARRAEKRGDGAVKVTLHDFHGLPQEQDSDVLDLSDALERLAVQDERSSQAVELFYFGGMTYREIGEALDISPATVERDLRFSRAWLRRELGRGSGVRDGDRA